MKGQYRVINELLLFGIGAILAISVAAIISTLAIPIQTQSQREQYEMIANLVSLATTKTYLCSTYGSCELSVEIPEKLSEDRYRIVLDNYDLSISNLRTRKGITVQPVYYEKTVRGFATSSGRNFVVKGNDKIILSKW